MQSFNESLTSLPDGDSSQITTLQQTMQELQQEKVTHTYSKSVYANIFNEPVYVQ